jgi:hypothetical protein
MASGARGMTRGVRSAVGRISRILALVAVAAMLLGVAGPWRGSVINWGSGTIDAVRRTFFPRYQGVDPEVGTATASGRIRGHGSKLAFDGDQATFWAIRGDGVGSSLSVEFAQPVDIDRIDFLPGAPDGSLTGPIVRPETVQVEFIGSDGASVKMETVVLENTSQLQQRKVSAKDVTRVMITINSTYETKEAGSVFTAFTEIDFAMKD